MSSLRQRPTPRVRAPARRPGRLAVPAPLSALLVVVALFGVAWALVVPPWQAPDENSHYAYGESLAQRFVLPGRADGMPQSTAQQAAANAAEADQVAASPPGRPPWSAAAEERWESLSLGDEHRSDGGGVNAAAANPPLYYLYAAGAYRISGGDAFSRLYGMRIAGVLWALVTVVGAWLLAGELFSRRRDAQFLAAAVAGLVPMVSFVSASVSVDGMLYALWSLALWLGVRVMRRGAEPRDAAAFALVVAAAILVKAASYALLPGALLAVAVGLRRRLRGRGRRPATTSAGLAAACLLAPLVVWWFVARSSERGAAEQIATSNSDFGLDRLRMFTSYLWQFYLPRAPWQDQVLPDGAPRLWDRWIQGSFGRFGWLEVKLPGWVYLLVAVAGLLVVAGAVVALVRRRSRLDRPVVRFFALVTVVLFLGLHWTDFNFVVTGGEFMQGRYVLPLVALAGAATVAAVGVLPARLRPYAAGAIVGALVAAQLLSLGTTLVRFHA